MKVTIYFASMPNGGHIFSTPTTHKVEHVEYTDEKQLQKYIESQKDLWGCPYKKKKSMGYDYISNQGGATVVPYKPSKSPNFKKI